MAKKKKTKKTSKRQRKTSTKKRVRRKAEMIEVKTSEISERWPQDAPFGALLETG